MFLDLVKMNDCFCGSDARINLSELVDEYKPFNYCLYRFLNKVELINLEVIDLLIFVLYKLSPYRTHSPSLLELLLCGDVSIKHTLHLILSAGTLSCLEPFAAIKRDNTPVYKYFAKCFVFVDDHTFTISKSSTTSDILTRFIKYSQPIHVKLCFALNDQVFPEHYFAVCYKLSFEEFEFGRRSYEAYQKGETLIALSGSRRLLICVSSVD